MTSAFSRQLGFVTCATDADVLRDRLLASECLASRRYPLFVHYGAASAAAAFNSVMDQPPPCDWLVWVHQDVFLPPGWDERFLKAIAEAEAKIAKVAVVGVYGIVGSGPSCHHVGHVLDRGTLWRWPVPLPCVADSLDELLFAVRADSGLRLDPALGFDLYATDLVLAARAAGWNAVVADAYCEHWSATPTDGNLDPAMVARVEASAGVFREKWAHRLPVTTTCLHLERSSGQDTAGESAAGSAQ